MAVNNDGKNSTTGSSDRRRGILVLDPAGKLKLARWRLQADGFNVFYIRDLSLLEWHFKQKVTDLVLLNVDAENDIELIDNVRACCSGVKIVAVTAEYPGWLLKHLSVKGVKSSVRRPLDFPQLSAVVRYELASLDAKKTGKNILGRFKRRVNVPFNVLRNNSGFRAILDQVKTAIMFLDASGHIKYVNEAMSSLLKPDGQGAVDKHYLEVVDGISYGDLLSVIKETFATLEASRNKEMVVTLNGESVPCEAEAYPVSNQHGAFAGAFLLVEDVSNPRKLEQVVAHSEKLALVGQLAAGAAHEIRNPLTSVRGFIQLLRTELQGTPKVEYINIIINEIDRVNTIINEFLKLAKPATPKRRPTNIRELFEEVRMLVEGEAFLNNIVINEEFADNLPDLMIDGEQVKQVLINVVRNAFEAMAEGGVLTLKVYQVPPQSKVCVEISDTGLGMEEVTVKRIFEPFYTTKDNGTGLGLAVSSEIMQSHGGTIEIKSNKGNGTTVYLCIPY